MLSCVCILLPYSFSFHFIVDIWWIWLRVVILFVRSHLLYSTLSLSYSKINRAIILIWGSKQLLCFHTILSFHRESNCGPPNNPSLTITLLWLKPMTLALIPFVKLWAVPFHLKTNWWWGSMAFDIMLHESIFRVVVGSQITVS